MSGLGDTLTGAGAVLGTGGLIGFVKWLFMHREKTVARLEKRVAALEDELREVWLAFSMVTGSLHAKDPLDPSLKVAARILRQKFPLEENTPQDMKDLLARIK